MDNFKENLYSDNFHNYNYDDLIKDELVEDPIKQNIDNRLNDKRPRNISIDSHIDFHR